MPHGPGRCSGFQAAAESERSARVQRWAGRRPPGLPRRRASTRGRCAPRSGPTRAACRGARRAPGGARGPRSGVRWGRRARGPSFAEAEAGRVLVGSGPGGAGVSFASVPGLGLPRSRLPGCHPGSPPTPAGRASCLGPWRPRGPGRRGAGSRDLRQGGRPETSALPGPWRGPCGAAALGGPQ